MSHALPRKPILAILAAAVALFAAAFADTDRASAGVPIHGFDVTVTSSEAGGHPNMMTRIEVGTMATEGAEDCFCNSVKDIFVNTPQGFAGVPRNVVQCKASELAKEQCPADSQVGVVSVRLFAPLEIGGAYFVQPLYSMEPQAGQLALLATLAPLLETPIYTIVSARTESDYGLEFKTFGIPRLIPPNEITQFTWGVPAASEHDDLRFPAVINGFGRKALWCWGTGYNPVPALERDEAPYDGCEFQGTPDKKMPPNAATNPPAPFLINPTSCTGPLKATLDIEGYEFSTDHAESPYPAMTGCDQLGFEPTLAAKPTTTEADTPSGLDVDLVVPQTLSPTSPSPSPIREVTVTLPPGLTLDSNAADGKTACTDAEARFGTRQQAACPEFSKIGTLQVVSSSLPGPLDGYIYLGAPLPGNRYRAFLVADGFSLNVKLPGTVFTDPQTGQLTMSLKDLPQTPFQEFDLHLFGAERGLLATPTHCGKYPVQTEFVPWADELPNQTSTQFFNVTSGPGGSPCPGEARPFEPRVESGVTDNTSGAHTKFSVNLIRRDGDQNLSMVSVTAPPGLTGKIAGIPYCPDATLAAAAAAGALGTVELTSPGCPAASRIGDTNAVAGAGSRPVNLPGSVYLAGPYKGAPLSMAIVTPAVSGPFDLGNVVLRVALHIDPVTAQIKAVSDPLPQIIEGIPVRLREVLLVLNRPGFALNPTNCSRSSVGATVSGTEGGSKDLTNQFQVADCGALPFGPKLKLKFSGATKRRGHPEIRGVLTARKGDANISRAVVTMPPGMLLDNTHIETVCTRALFAADNCPPGSILGSAMAESPLLDEPLRGPVTLRTSSNDLPDLVVSLKGQVDIELASRIDSESGRLRASFESVPDLPVSKFVLDLAGGKKGLLVNSKDLCSTARRAKVRMVGQNGRSTTAHPKVGVRCGKKQSQRRGRQG